MRLIYYSLYLGGQPDDKFRVLQVVKSIESLRNYNQDIRIQVHSFGGFPDDAAAHLRSLSVDIVFLDSYEAIIEQHLAGCGELLAIYPVLHKFLTMSEIIDLKPDQVLYLDNDTYIHGDVAPLFDFYNEKDLYAREETYTRKSHFGYKPSYVDEDKLFSIAVSESCKPMLPFNSGVVMMNNKVWERMMLQASEYLAYVVRFTMWMEANISSTETTPDIAYLRKHRGRLADYLSQLEPLPYPSTNFWIKEQLALWLTVGKVQDLEFGFIKPDHVLQGCEEFACPQKFARPIVSHYFSHNTERFYSSLDSPVYIE